MARELYRATSGSNGRRNVAHFSRALGRADVADMVRQLQRGGPVRYSARGDDEAKQRMDTLLSHLGPVGEVIRSVVTKGSGDFTKESLNAAISMIRAFGGEVLVKRGEPGYDRGLQAARQILEEEGYTVTAPGEETTTPQPESTLPRHLDTDTMEPADMIYDPEIRVDSSSVYSYAFVQETENFGTLYVTFLAWTPGSGKTDAAGATYAYHQVDLSRYQAFKREAAKSAGTAVWDYLRVRGTVHAHQVPYELVGGVLIQGGGTYIPRKAASRGFFRRTVQRQGARRGSHLRSSLPSREFLPNRGEPNRGQPNRGEPNRGR
jgi:hypothetical protein